MARKGLNIYKRKDGRWEGRYQSGYTPEGKIRYTSVYAKSYTTVKARLEERKASALKDCPKCRMTFGELAKLWLSDAVTRIKSSTYANYQMKLTKHILPFFSGLKYDLLTAEKLNLFVRSLQEAGLSGKYISDMVILLKAIAKFASRRYGYADRISSAALPKIDTVRERARLSAGEQKVLCAAVLGDPTLSNTGILLAYATGLRIGELCGLKWSDIDLEKSILTVRRTVQRIQSPSGGRATRLSVGTPKSRTSQREIPLPAFLLPVLKKLRSEGAHFFLSNSPEPTEPRTMQYRFRSLLRSLSLPTVNFHQLRHLFATNCIEASVDTKTLSEILGHSSVEVTLNRYVHSSAERKRICMQMVAEKLELSERD